MLKSMADLVALQNWIMATWPGSKIKIDYEFQVLLVLTGNNIWPICYPFDFLFRDGISGAQDILRQTISDARERR